MNAAQVPRNADGRHVVLYDGVCALCSGFVRFVLAWDRGAVFRFAPLQGPLGNRVQPEAPLRTVYVLADFGSPAERSLTKARAVLFVLNALGWPWKAAAIVRVLPLAWLDGIYDLVARHRYRVFGRYDVCPLPGPEHRSRFIGDTGEMSDRGGS
jgi:predicted DCC family thiol-disulfide oxidoreductase YuxK